jgi:spermidine/putrescine transport system permease protein
MVVVLLELQRQPVRQLPDDRLSFRWFIELAENEAILRAFRTSIVLGLLTAVISTTSACSRAWRWCATTCRAAT